MRRFLEEMQKSNEEWRALKLVVLGHGGIGKSTLLRVLKTISSNSDIDTLVCTCILSVKCINYFSP